MTDLAAVQQLLARERLSVDRCERVRTTFLSHLGAALRVSRKTGKYSYALFLVLLTAVGSLTGSNYAGKPTLLFTILMLTIAVEARQQRTRSKEAAMTPPAPGRPTAKPAR